MVFLVGETVGIDFGTTYSSLAHLGPDGSPVMISNADGLSRASSVVLLSENGRVLVSPSFERISIEGPSHTIEDIKRQMGNRDFYIVYQGKRLCPEFISALIMKKLKQDSEKKIGPIANAVVTVPYYFNEHCRKATQDAGQIAGLNVIDILAEPAAATLAYNWLESDFGRANLRSKETTLLVFDLGGGKFEVTAVRYIQRTIHVLASEADVTLAGSNWTQRIADYVCEEFKRKFTEDPRGDPVGLRVIFEKCEDAKRQLSAVSQVPICIQHREQILNVLLTRNDFQRITADLLQRTANATARVLQQAKVNSGDVDQVIQVGGATAMPAVGEMLQRLCNHRQSQDFRPEEAVALGAAIHAANLERDWRDLSRFSRW